MVIALIVLSQVFETLFMSIMCCDNSMSNDSKLKLEHTSHESTCGSRFVKTSKSGSSNEEFELQFMNRLKSTFSVVMGFDTKELESTS